MDREFMKSFYRNYYEDVYSEAIKEFTEYQEKQIVKYDLQAKIEEELSEKGLKLFEQFLDALADEQEILLQEMYLLGAQDRERMLR